MLAHHSEARGGRFYRPDDRIGQASPRSAFVHSFWANRTDRIIGWYQSQLNRTSFPYLSENERQAMMWLDLLPTVQSYGAQSHTINFTLDGMLREYTPDIDLRLITDSRVFIEIKPDSELDDAVTAARLVAAGRVIRARGAKLKILTDRDIKREPRRSNVNQLQAYRSWEPEQELAYLMDIHLARHEVSTIGRLAEESADKVHGRETVMSLIYRRHLQISLNQILSDATPVWHANLT